MNENPIPTLREFLANLIENWERTPIRVEQDGRWQSLFLSEIKDGGSILEWILQTKGRFWNGCV